MKKHKFIEPFIQFVRGSKEYELLIKKRPSAFVLLSLIARRARKTSEVIQEGLDFDNHVSPSAEEVVDQIKTMKVRLYSND